MTDVVSRSTNHPSRVNLSALRSGLGVSRERMARLLDVSAKTIERWEDRAAVPTSRAAIERLTKLRDIVDLGLQVYTSDAFGAFLTTPMPIFGGRSALQLIELGDIDLVYGEIVADYEGGGF